MVKRFFSRSGWDRSEFFLQERMLLVRIFLQEWVGLAIIFLQEQMLLVRIFFAGADGIDQAFFLAGAGGIGQNFFLQEQVGLVRLSMGVEGIGQKSLQEWMKLVNCFAGLSRIEQYF